jgi:hypothetical protein
LALLPGERARPVVAQSSIRGLVDAAQDEIKA